jgi:polyamine oxidase
MMPVAAIPRDARSSTAFLRTNWSMDPYSYGSYSYIAKKAKQKDHARLATPINNRVFFAGEATHPKYNSTVHAAYESGIMASDAVARSGAKNIAIIGAGISGLAAAHALSYKGLDVQVIEARNRLGGRIWTTTMGDTAVDLGASWIHGTEGNPITDIANELNLQRWVTDDSGVYRGSDGKNLSEDDLPSWFEDVIEVQHEAGTTLENLNWRAYSSQPEYDGDEVIFANGYADIFKALAGEYSVSLGRKVQNVSYSDLSVSIKTQICESHYDAVIVTLPLGVLKSGDVTFEPPLPRINQKAIDRLGMGVLDKLYLRFDTIFWDKDVTWIETPETGLPAGQFNGWFNLARFTGEPIIMAFNGGQPARDLSKLSDGQLIERGESVLRKAYPA